jgi:succinate dehydrogenase / fumarate reductase, cytochrome b subunit
MKAKLEGPRNVGVFDLMRYRFPLTAIASILHRITGLLLFIFIPFLLCLLDQSLASEASYRKISTIFNEPLARLLLWVGMNSLVYHVLAGLKHLLMDFGLFESLKTGLWASRVVVALSILYALMLGVVLW